jgi:peptidoglycan/xylan/chitin deacetylase (PgdA/CDA1 family)
MYHAIESAEHPAGARDAGEQCYVLRLEEFGAQMAFLHREGYRTLLLDELLSRGQVPERAVVLTFDDGHASNLSLALPVLQRYGFRAHFFITTGWLGTRHYLREGELGTLKEAGMSIGSHGMSHAFLDRLDRAMLDRELLVSKETLRKITGAEIEILSAPGGRVGTRTEQAARSAGYRLLCTSRPGLWRPAADGFRVPRIALYRDGGMINFSGIVRRDPRSLEPVISRYRWLEMAKRALGERGYHLLRRLFWEL